MKKLYQFLFFFIICHLSGYGQDFIYIYKVPDRALILDSNIIRINTTVDKFIARPEKSFPRNTLFFRMPILFDNVKSNKVFCYWSWLQNLQFRNSIFSHQVLFEHVGADTLFMMNNYFKQGVLFTDESIQTFIFSNNKIDAEGRFRQMHFRSAVFRKMDMNKCYFDRCLFDSVYFVGCSMDEFGLYLAENLDIGSNGVKWLINLDSSTILKKIDLSSLNPNCKVSLYRTKIPGIVDLSNNPSLINNIDLRVAKYNPNKRSFINLYNTDVSKIDFEYRHFKVLTDDKDELSTERTIVVFESLLKSFKEKNQIESYELLKSDYESYKFALLPLADKLWLFYAGKLSNVLYWTLFWIIVFTIGNLFCYRKLNREVYTLENFPFVQRFSKTRFKRGWNYFYYCLLYTVMVFFSLNIKNGRLKYDNKWLLTYFLIIYTIGVVSIFLIAQLAFR